MTKHSLDYRQPLAFIHDLPTAHHFSTQEKQAQMKTAGVRLFRTGFVNT